MPPRPGAATVRLFTALWPDAATRAAIAACQHEWAWPQQAAPVRAERLHITLHFLGDVAAQRLPELVRELRVPFEAFTLDLVHAEVWPNAVAVLEPATVPPALAQLHGTLGKTVAQLRLPVDARPYRPHVTLARRAQGAAPPAQRPAIRWPAPDGYVLVRSLPGGAGYEVLERYA
jgi:RNA 2',3'-cyclic 3'-phosphodiesterase